MPVPLPATVGISFCSATQAEGESSTIGHERLVNPVLTLGEHEYVQALLAGLDAYRTQQQPCIMQL